jgi:NADH-quinone oxidoreductase subunit N
MGVVAGTERGITASAIYLLAYTFMNLGIWAGVILLRRKDIPGERVEDFDGLFFRHPALAILMLVFFLSLAGIPPLAGFIAKYYVFTAVLEVAFTQGEPYSSLMVWLAVVGALNVVVSIFYYLRIVVAMFMKTEYLPVPLSFSKGLVVVLVVTGVFTVLIGVYPEPFIQLAQFVNLPLI